MTQTHRIHEAIHDHSGSTTKIKASTSEYAHLILKSLQKGIEHDHPMEDEWKCFNNNSYYESDRNVQ